MASINTSLLLCACLLAMAGSIRPAHAQTAPGIDPGVMTPGFLSAHPDLRWRQEGIRSLEKGDTAIAMRQFKRSAHHADKPSQALIADMYWSGKGVPVDRPLGYAWMDLAAERLYPDLIVLRERYWGALSDTERERAIALGQAVYAEYGDDVAKPRLARILERERRRMTGSRTGSLGRVNIILPTQGGTVTLYTHGMSLHNQSPAGAIGSDARTTVSGDRYYADEYWHRDAYFALQDRMYGAPGLGHPRVEVGDLEPVHEREPDRED